MRILLITNPASGGGTDGGGIGKRLRAAGATLTEDAPDRVVVCGGDGTVALGAERAAELGVPLAVLATGTANDFARANELPDDLDDAVALAVTGTGTTAHDLGRMDGRPFLNVAAAGIAPAAARRAAPLKPVLGPFAYPVGAVIAAVAAPPVDIAVPPHYDGRAWQVLVAVTGAFGGVADIDAADPCDGRLDLLVLPAGPRVGLLRHALHMRAGSLADAPGVVHARAAELTLTVPGGTRFSVDGEVVGAGPAVTFTVEPGAFALVTAAA